MSAGLSRVIKNERPEGDPPYTENLTGQTLLLVINRADQICSLRPFSQGGSGETSGRRSGPSR